MSKESGWVRRAFQVGGLLVLLWLVFSFSRRMAEFTRLSGQLEREGARITELVASQSNLLDQIAFATSEAAVEQWAREDARMAQPGDYAVIPLAPPGTTPQASTALQVTQEPLTNWNAWLQWLFYAGP
ncbi:MAG: hypothetical protein O3B43_04775 [Chloroflexi bacterium]|nr:hypothetical protein [Chloroflexota bacterium]